MGGWQGLWQGREGNDRYLSLKFFALSNRLKGLSFGSGIGAQIRRVAGGVNNNRQGYYTDSWGNLFQFPQVITHCTIRIGAVSYVRTYYTYVRRYRVVRFKSFRSE